MRRTGYVYSPMRCAVLKVGGKSRNCVLSVGSEGGKEWFLVVL